MEFKKSPPELVERFHELARLVPDATPKQMFGYPTMVLAGNMFMGLHGDGMILRLADPDLRTFMDEAGAKPFEPMPGRPMRGYALAPRAVVGDRAIERWIARSYAYAQSLPPKAAKSRRPAKRGG